MNTANKSNKINPISSEEANKCVLSLLDKPITPDNCFMAVRVKKAVPGKPQAKNANASFFDFKVRMYNNTYDGLFKFSNFKVSSVQEREENGKKQIQLQSTVSQAGDLGPFLANWEKYWKQSVGVLDHAQLIDIGKRKVCELVQTAVGDSNPDRALRGQAIDDPIVRLKVDFSLNSDKHPMTFFRGKPRTVLTSYNDRKAELNKQTGKVEISCPPATVFDAEHNDMVPVTVDNIKDYFTPGSMIVKGVVSIGCITCTSSYVVMTKVLTYAQVERSVVDGYDLGDDDYDLTEAASALTIEMPPHDPQAAPSTAPDAHANDQDDELFA